MDTHTQPAGSPVVRALFYSAGTIAVLLALLGAFLPVLPTTPFMILAAACYAKVSPRLYRRLIENRLFGPTILRWRKTRTISLKAKCSAVGLIYFITGCSAYFFLDETWMRVMLLSIATAVSVWLLTRPSKTSGD